MKKIIGMMCVLALVLASAAALAADVGDCITLGAYEQDNDPANGKEPIEWLVLDRDGDRLLVVSRYVLDDQPCHMLDEAVSWATCYLRVWLNGHFMNEAFTGDERAQILPTTLHAAGGDTQDQIFLLSRSEALTYFPEKQDRACKPTDYAEAQGAMVPAHTPTLRRFMKDVVTTTWWLRSADAAQTSAPHVLVSGGAEDSSNHVTVECGVRPAMWIHLAQ